MPNIEIHGLPQTEARDKRAKIFGAFSDRPYIDEMVVTISPTDVQDKNRESQPFLRLVSTPQDFTSEIIRRLERFGLDIEEAAPLRAFYPKQKTG